MSSGCQIHKSQQRIDVACARLAVDPEVSPENRELILRFSKNRLAMGSSGFRIVKCMYCLRFLAHWLKKGFDQATKEDLITLVGDLESKQYAEWSKYDFKIVLKVFYKWLKGTEDGYPLEVKWLKPKLRNTAHKLPEELLTEEEVLNLARVATHPRDKALVLVLYESGCRIGELLSLKMKNVQFDQHGAVLRVTGKTGDRRVRIINSAPALTAWIDLYAHSSEPDATLWPPRSNNYYKKGQPAESASIYVLLKDLGRKAGLSKKVYPHLFRHSRATWLATKFTEAQMKEYFGWTQGSEMASTYVHLSGRDVDNTLLALYGKKEGDTQPQVQTIQTKTCPRCKENNSAISKYCFKCGSPLETRFVPIDMASEVVSV